MEADDETIDLRGVKVRKGAEHYTAKKQRRKAKRNKVKHGFDAHLKRSPSGVELGFSEITLTRENGRVGR